MLGGMNPGVGRRQALGIARVVVRQLVDEAEAVLGGIRDRGVGADHRGQICKQAATDEVLLPGRVTMALGQALRVGEHTHRQLALGPQIPEARRDLPQRRFSHGRRTVAT
jgi:hypothetical protein